MPSKTTVPGLRMPAVLLIAISLSLGWGIRGNYGHEYGAAFAGGLAAIAACLMSGREDWRERVAYFAFFGAIGWGFGGMISYMQVVGYTHSGHGLSQAYGFAGLWWIGFLWAGLGGAGTALPGVMDRRKLTDLFAPILFVFGAWTVQWLTIDWIAEWLQRASAQANSAAFDDRWHRHESPLYWLDTDYLEVFFALAGLCAFDLWDRRERNGLFLPLFAAAGALIGFLFQAMLNALGWAKPFAQALSWQVGDPEAINPETGQPFGPDNFLSNWPQWFGDFPEHLGWFIGILIGAVVYFALFGKFRRGASLFVYMACGWVLMFLAFPVLGSLFFTDIGGLRMTAPRSDDWAGVTGLYIGMSVWMFRRELKSVAFVSVVSGFIGGFGFAGMQFLKLMMTAPGNPAMLRAHGVEEGTERFAEITQTWANWQAQNWHSFLEQSYGFVNGLAIAVSVGLLSALVRRQDDGPRPLRPWTEIVSAFCVLLGLTYLNIVKNVRTWVEQLRPAHWQRTIELADGATEQGPALWDIPLIGRLPGVEILEMTPKGWFNLTWWLFIAAFFIVVWRHQRRPIAAAPRTGLGKGQLIYLLLLWTMVIANFERALPAFTEGRILTEWVIIVNAVIATVLVLTLPREDDYVLINEPESFTPLYKRAWKLGLAAAAVCIGLFMIGVRVVYGDQHSGHSGYHTRFGEDATWRIEPNLKGSRHK